jgi:hypothetical protein
MAFIPVPDCAMATIFYLSSTNVEAINRFYCATAGVPTATDLEEIGDALYDVWVAQVMENVTENWSLTGIHVRAMNEEEGLQFIDENSYPIVGERSAAVNPANQVSYTVTWGTGLVGRSARGRSYGVGLPNDFHDGVRLSDTGQGLLQANWNLVRTAMETAGHALQVVSFIDGGVPRAEGRALAALTSTVRFPLATQRRRLA